MAGPAQESQRSDLRGRGIRQSEGMEHSGEEEAGPSESCLCCLPSCGSFGDLLLLNKLLCSFVSSNSNSHPFGLRISSLDRAR